MSTRRLFLTLIVLTTAVLGCAPAPDPQAKPFAPGRQADDEEGVMCVICLDLSGSFRDMMAEQGKAWDFTVNVLDRLFRRVGPGDEVVLAQLSATDRPLLFHGSSAELREQYDSAE